MESRDFMGIYLFTDSTVRESVPDRIELIVTHSGRKLSTTGGTFHYL
jgi:hypothetical protein